MAAADAVNTQQTRDVLKSLRLDDVPFHQRYVINRPPTPQDLLELSARIYKNSRRLYHEADSQGMRVYHDELIMGDVRLVMLVPSWFPKAHVAFDWDRVQGDTVSVVLVIRGTCQDLIGNTKANLQLLFNKLVDDEHLPDVAADATKVIQAWLLELLLRQPQLDAGSASSSSGSSSFVHGADAFGRLQLQKQPGQKQLHLDVHVTGHSLGGLLAEVATVESHNFAAAHGATWHCTSFESPGLPELYHRAALRCQPQAHWDDAMVSYLAAPNAINMLYEHLGSVVHVVVPWEQTWSHVAKCVGADVARVTAWAIVGGMVLAGVKQLTSSGSAAAASSAAANVVGQQQQQQQQQEEESAQQCPVGLGVGLPRLQGLVMQHASQQQPGGVQNCNAVMPQVVAGIGSIGAAVGNLASGVTSSGVSLGVPATVVGTAVVGPPVPTVFTVAETVTSSGRTLASVGSGFAGTSMAAAVNAAAAAASASATVSGRAAGIAAAAGQVVTSASSARVLQYVARKSGLGVLANAVGGWLLGRGGVWGALECLAGVLGVEVEELIAQHALGPMRQCFEPHTGQLKPQYKRQMASWPHLGHRRRVLLTAAKQVAKWSVPSFICRDNVGVANIMSRTAMVEARCARLKGYVVKEGQMGAAVYDALHHASGLDTAAGAAAAQDTDPMLQQLLHVEQGLLRHSTPEQAEISAHIQQLQPSAAAGGLCEHPMVGASTSAATASTATPRLPARIQMHRKTLRPAGVQQQQQQQQLDTGSGAGAAIMITGAEQLQEVEGDSLQALFAGAAAMDLDADVCEGLPDSRGEGLGVSNDMMDFEEMSRGQANGNMQLAFGGC